MNRMVMSPAMQWDIVREEGEKGNSCNVYTQKLHEINFFGILATRKSTLTPTFLVSSPLKCTVIDRGM